MRSEVIDLSVVAMSLCAVLICADDRRVSAGVMGFVGVSSVLGPPISYGPHGHGGLTWSAGFSYSIPFG